MSNRPKRYNRSRHTESPHVKEKREPGLHPCNEPMLTVALREMGAIPRIKS